MTDEITHTILPNSGSGWGGTALGAGFGGLIGSWLGNGFGGFGGINSSIDRGIGALNLNIADQGAQSRLQAQELAAQQQSCCCSVLRAIEQEGCANRELQREIQTQALRDVLTTTQAENAALKSQIFQTAAMAQQTATIINALKPATTAAAG